MTIPNDPFSEFSSDKEVIEFSDELGREYSVEVVYAFSIEDREYLLTSPIQDGDLDLINLESDGFHSEVGGFCVLRLEQDTEGEEHLHEVVDNYELEEIKDFLEETYVENS
ncbi:MAG: hypothetical protein CK427_11985 [Leptospira sp.]|nr:MAG: hypothetical protein CK427_11985 [Leptospira sp.]